MKVITGIYDRSKRIIDDRRHSTTMTSNNFNFTRTRTNACDGNTSLK